MTKPSASSLRKLPAILVVDDEIRSQEALRRTLEEDFDVLCASGADEGMAILEREQPVSGIRIVLCDQRMPGTTGVQFLKEVRDRWPDIVRIILSGYTDAEDIITGVNEAGIWQYLLKPWQPEQLLLTLQRAAEVWRLQQENQRLSLDLRTAEPVLKRHVDTKQEKAKSSFGLSAVIRAPGSPLNAVCDMVQRVAPFDLSVMVTGESGTGKEMVARAIHYESRRATKAFITENCGALPDTLLESELFGYKRGAFTGAVDDRVGLFQQADGGTLFLDEIGELPLELQPKLLRVLENGEYQRVGETQTRISRARIIAATNRDLRQEIRAGRFRADLFHRLSVFTVAVPPLREMGEDRLRLLEHFRALYCSQAGLTPFSLAPAAKALWLNYAFPGNVRELRNIVIRLTTRQAGQTVMAEQLLDEFESSDIVEPAMEVSGLAAQDLEQTRDAARKHLQEAGRLNLDATLELWERGYMEAAIELSAGNMSQAARRLGINRTTLYNRLEGWNRR